MQGPEGGRPQRRPRREPCVPLIPMGGPRPCLPLLQNEELRPGLAGDQISPSPLSGRNRPGHRGLLWEPRRKPAGSQTLLHRARAGATVCTLESHVSELHLVCAHAQGHLHLVCAHAQGYCHATQCTRTEAPATLLTTDQTPGLCVHSDLSSGMSPRWAPGGRQGTLLGCDWDPTSLLRKRPLHVLLTPGPPDGRLPQSHREAGVALHWLPRCY